MDKSLMPAFRLVGAQIKTAKAELSRSRPKGSPKLTANQRYWRIEAKSYYDAATSIYLVAEQDNFSDDAMREMLLEASSKASCAQFSWRKAHPSDERMIEMVKL